MDDCADNNEEMNDIKESVDEVDDAGGGLDNQTFEDESQEVALEPVLNVTEFPNGHA